MRQITQIARIRFVLIGKLLFVAEPEMTIVVRTFSWSHNSRSFPRGRRGAIFAASPESSPNHTSLLAAGERNNAFIRNCSSICP